MPLPKINTPTYELVLPSTGKKIKYRPFLVREEKILIMALESEDMKQITDAIIEILKACILTRGVKLSNLSTFDMEYLFLNVRGKSVGETIKIQKDKSHKNIVKLDDQLSMKLKYPSINQFIESNFETSEDTASSDISTTMEMITSCIDMIYNAEESWNSNDSTKKELTEFVESLNTKQFKDVEEFFRTMPKLSHTVKVTNPHTKVESDVVLEGLAAFFS